MKQHDQDLLRRAIAAPDVDANAPGRETRSAHLTAPANPVVSGLVQRTADGAGASGSRTAEAAVSEAKHSTGSSLPATLMRKFETALGADLSGVRVHTGAPSASAAAAVSAKAYAHGQDIHFAAGQYDPGSSAGEHLLAHEVAHTVQQRGGTPQRQNKLEVSGPTDSAELEADRAADAMVAGASTAVTTAGGVQRAADSKKPQYQAFQAGNLESLFTAATEGPVDPTADWGVPQDNAWALVWCFNRCTHDDKLNVLDEGARANDALAFQMLVVNSIPQFQPFSTHDGSQVASVFALRARYDIPGREGQLVLEADDPGEPFFAYLLDQEGGPLSPGEPVEPPDVEAP